jgi:CelD/BcsL family acetyltransferase involved in cellulose biosynthesis
MPTQEATTTVSTRVLRFTALDGLLPYAQDWDRLSNDIPFRSWSWLSGWWRHYGPGPGRRDRARSLFVLGVFDQDAHLIGVAPWYLDRSTWQGRVLRFLGTGEVCSEYLGVLAASGREDTVVAALARWLSSARAHDAWDLLELTRVSAEDGVVARLAERLAAHGNLIHRRDGPVCWRIELPDTWDEYLAMLSKQHRNQLRKAERRMLDSGRAVVEWVRRPGDLPQAQQVLIKLHQARRNLLGEPGCFSSDRFTAFHCEAMHELLRRGQLGLFRIELDGRPFVVEYMLCAGKTVYLYQCGLDTSRLNDSPGRLGNLACLRFAMEHGYRVFDFLRGDEPYKAHFRAKPYRCLEIRVIPTRCTAQVRHGIWRAGSAAKSWLASQTVRAS